MADDSAGGRRLSPNLTAGLVLVVLILAIVAWKQPWKSEEAPGTQAMPADAAQKIATQVRALEAARTEAEFVDAAGDTKASDDWAKDTFANLELLGATDLRMRFLSGGDSGVREDGSTQATVEVSWRPGSTSALASTPTKLSDVSLVLDPEDDGTFAIRDAERGDGALPLWLAGKVTQDDQDGARVFRVDGGDARRDISAEAAWAQAAVRRVVPTARKQLVVISPRTKEQAAALLDQTPDSVAQIAAVTTTLDGSDKGAVVVILNPAVFDTMDDRAGQVVMSHEATHLMTSATTSRIETWVVEGFADFVALHDDTAPLSVSAGQILRSVKADGPPKALPTAADFGSTEYGLGGTYESAWMIFRMLGERYGDADIVGFYDAVLDGMTPAKAAEDAFGLSIAEITRDWRAYLEKSASIGS